MTRYLFALILFLAGLPARGEPNAHEALARDIFQELVEINTTDSVGSVTRASEAMAKRLRDAGIPAADIQVLGPNEQKKNLVVRLHGTGTQRPILFIGHLDVVEAPRVDWATDPFEFVEKDGYYYGRGTQDMKASDATLVATLIRLWKEGFKPSRDIIVALTAGEESFRDNGVQWLLAHHRQLVDAELVINLDGGGVLVQHGRPVSFLINAAEKLYADFQLTVINPGGPSAQPSTENAIARLAAGVIRLSAFRFPFELNDVTRTHFTREAAAATGARAQDLAGLLLEPPDPAAVERLSQNVYENAMLHTNCVATRFNAGHANNALPQEAVAVFNCRILPGHSAEEVRQVILRVLNDPAIAVRYVREYDGQVSDRAPDAIAMAAMSPPREILAPLETVVASMWPGLPVIPTMSVGESDAVWTTAAGMPTFALSGLATDREDIRAHGKDERVRIDSFNQGLEFFYEYLALLTRSTN